MIAVEYPANAYNRIYIQRPRPGRLVRAEDIEEVVIADDARLRVRHDARRLHIWVESSKQPDFFSFQITLRHPLLTLLDESETRFEGFEVVDPGLVSPTPVTIALARVRLEDEEAPG